MCERVNPLQEKRGRGEWFCREVADLSSGGVSAMPRL